MTRPAQVANYLLGVDLAALDEPMRPALVRELLARWPDLTQHDLEAGFGIAMLETAARLAGTLADRCDEVAIELARATSLNAVPA